ncbi:MAG TPA: DegT/DnrJ/EryC1/StrS family aminotransferase, partial [Chitinophagales bacterium]|nr:DegT/DnrJ/EryC1/StrS family aminotransferase [Chitinophagales bacterium]
SGLRVLETQGAIGLPHIPEYATNNGHLFFILCQNIEVRTHLINYLNGQGINAVFHYLPLHKSPYYAAKHGGRGLPNTDKFADTLLRLPLFYTLTDSEQQYIIENVLAFFRQ